MIGVGLELGANVIKIAVVEKRGQATKIRDFEVHKIDAKKGDTEDDVVSVVDGDAGRWLQPAQAARARPARGRPVRSGGRR